MVFLLFSGLEFAKEKTRKYLTSGIPFYPSTKESLNLLMDRCFSQAIPKAIEGKMVGIIAPHAGISISGPCAASAYKALKTSTMSQHMKRIILLGISHRGGFYGASVSTFDYNSTPLGKIPVDTSITKKLAGEKFFKVNNMVMEREHSIENQLPFLQKVFDKISYKIVPILFGQVNKKDFKTIANTIKKYVNEQTLVVCSTDLTHYGSSYYYAPFTKDIKSNLTKLDSGMIKYMLDLDIEGYYAYKQKTGITMCGFIPVGIMIEMFSDGGHKATLMDYYKSGDLTKDYSNCVSYASIVVSKGNQKSIKNPSELTGLNNEEKKELIAIAKTTLREYFKSGRTINNIEKKFKISKNMKQLVGVFVTLKKNNHLRGCIGSIIGRVPLFLGVRDNILNSAFNDRRFNPVKKEELKDIDIEISVMTPLKRIDHYKKIKLGIDGVIIKKSNHQAVFLPQVAKETGWSLDQFLSHLCQKAGLPSNSYLPPASKDMEFYVFQAQVFGEKTKI